MPPNLISSFNALQKGELDTGFHDPELPGRSQLLVLCNLCPVTLYHGRLSAWADIPVMSRNTNATQLQTWLRALCPQKSWQNRCPRRKAETIVSRALRCQPSTRRDERLVARDDLTPLRTHPALYDGGAWHACPLFQILKISITLH